MKTTTNTRQLTGASDAECKCMALMLHFGNPYFEHEGILYNGKKGDALERYDSRTMEDFEGSLTFEGWLQEYGDFEPIDTTLDAIRDVNYLVLDCSNATEIQDHKDLICGKPLAGMEVINDNLYLIFQL